MPDVGFTRKVSNWVQKPGNIETNLAGIIMNENIFVLVAVVCISFNLSVIFRVYVVPKLGFLDVDLIEWLQKTMKHD